MTAGLDAPRSATPLADAVLANPLAVPAGVAPWLRSWERRLRDTMHLARGRVQLHPRTTPAVEDAMAELRELHPDARTGVFRLLLQRPLWQLAEGSAARETFDRYAGTVLQRVHAALELLDALAPLEAERSALIAEFGELFPNRVTDELARARGRDEDVARLRRAVDAQRMRVRLSRARAVLERVADTARGEGFVPTAGRVVAGEKTTLAEMVVRLAVERRVRRKLERHSAELRAHRGHLAAELRGLALSAPPRGAGRGSRGGHNPVVLEHLIAAAAGAGGTSLDAADAPHWTGALAAAMSAHHPGSDRFTWLPVLMTEEPATTDSDAEPAGQVELLHAVPLDDGFVYLSPAPESVIRVRTRSVRLGELVECQVAPEMVRRLPHALTDRDVAAMFDGLDASHSRWYGTATRGSARIVASHGAGWFARLERKGVVEALDQPPWHVEAGGSAFRVLRPASPIGSTAAHAPTSIPAAFTGDGVRASFLGFTLRDVRTGLAGDERAWARGVTSRWRGATDSMRREFALMAALHRAAADRPASGAALGLRPLGWATASDADGLMPLYRIPLATIDGHNHLRHWIVEQESHLLAVLAGVARVVEAVHAAGYALGTWHTEAFAYGLSWRPQPLVPVPTVLLAHAPCSARLGEPYAPPAAREMLPSHYRMLRTPVLVPQVAGAQLATRERDMQGFTAFVIDLLLDRPIVDRGVVDWYDADGVVRGSVAECTRRPELVKLLLRAIDDPLGWRRMLALVERLAAGRIGSLAELG